MKTVIAKNNWFADDDLRLDASFHLSEGHLTLITFKKIGIKTEPLSMVTERIFYGGRSKRVYVNNPQKGLPFIKGADIIKADFSSLKYISKARTANLEDYFLEEGWTLITRSGTIGNTAYVNKDFIEKAASDDIIRVVPKNIPSGFLYAFLSSKYGQNLLKHGTYGAVIQHIEPEHIQNIPIPIFPPQKKEEIHDLIVEAAELRVEANRLLEKAKSLLSKNLKLEKETASEIKASFLSISKVTNSFQQRIDAPVFINKGVETMETLQMQGIKFILLKECNISVTRPGIFKRIYVNNKGLPYIKGSELNLNNPFTNCEYLSKTKTPFLNELKLKENQILMTCAGSVGSVRIITKEFEDKKAIGSQDIIRIDGNDGLFTKEYLFAYFRIPFVYDYIQSLKYGSVIERIEPFHVERIPVFVPTKKLSEQITWIINQYKDCVYNAFNKESQAIHLIEKEIDSWQQS